MKKLLSLLFIICCTTNVWANLAAPSQGGQSLTEPNGIKNVDIIKEDLTIDFTQLADENIIWSDREINVEAIYEIDNPSEIKNLELVFVIVSESKNFQFYLNDKEINSQPIDNKEFADRQSWKKPSNTPYENKEIMYNPANHTLKSAKFTLNLPKGKHTLRAKYKAKPTVHKDVGMTKGWQFAYSLAPARDWKSFGELNLNIKIPNGWKFFSNLKLEQTGDNLSGKFNEIPADFLAVTTQMPRPINYNSAEDSLFFAFLGVAILFPLFLAVLAFVQGYKWNNSWLYGVLLAIVGAIVAAIIAYFSVTYPDTLIPEGQYASYGYGDLGVFFEVIFFGIIAVFSFVISVVLWIGIVWIKTKKLNKV
jgi:hypothetical protein